MPMEMPGQGQNEKKQRLAELLRRRAETAPELEPLYRAFEKAGEDLAHAFAASEETPKHISEAKTNLKATRRKRLFEKMPGGKAAMKALYIINQLIGGSMAQGNIYRETSREDIDDAREWLKEEKEAMKRLPEETVAAESALVQTHINLQRAFLKLTQKQKEDLMELDLEIEEARK